MFFRRNNLNIGIGLGILVPLIVFSMMYSVVSLGELRRVKIRTLALIGVCLNMLLIHFFRKNRANESIRGLVIATFAMALGWFAWFYNEITAEW